MKTCKLLTVPAVPSACRRMMLAALKKLATLVHVHENEKDKINQRQSSQICRHPINAPTLSHTKLLEYQQSEAGQLHK